MNLLTKPIDSERDRPVRLLGLPGDWGWVLLVAIVLVVAAGGWYMWKKQKGGMLYGGACGCAY